MIYEPIIFIRIIVIVLASLNFNMSYEYFMSLNDEQFLMQFRLDEEKSA